MTLKNLTLPVLLFFIGITSVACDTRQEDCEESGARWDDIIEECVTEGVHG